MKVIPALRKVKRATTKAAQTTKKVVSTSKRVVKRTKGAVTDVKKHYAYYYKYAPVNPKRMLFDSFAGRGISDSPYAVLQEMMRQGIADDYEIYFTSRDIKRDKAFVEANNLPVKLLDFYSLKYPYILATAKYLLSNSSYPVYFIRRPEQVFVETWHGTPLKTLGKQIKNGMQSLYFAQHSFLQSTVLTFPNDFTRDVMMRDYNLESLYTGRVAMVGYPRNAVFLQERDASVREKYSLDGHANFAYMPTWRGTSSLDVNVNTYAEEIDAMLCEIDGKLDESQRIYVNLHSMVASSITLDSYEHILPFPTDIGTYDFLTQMDALITDYSSVMFDYALTRKPVILFAYDMEEYLADRGMYLSIEDLPFPIVKTIDELCSLMTSGEYLETTEAHKEFEKEFMNYDSADNAKHVLDLLLGNDVPDVPIIDYAKNREHELTVVDATPQKSLANIRGILDSADSESEVVLLKRTGFGATKSNLVYEDYLDRQFVFVTNANPMTYQETLLRKHSPEVARELEMRNRLRVLGDVPTAPEARRYYVGKGAGSSYNGLAELRLNASAVVEGGIARLKLLDDQYKPKRVVLAWNRSILWARLLTEKEASSGTVELDLLTVLCDSTFLTKNKQRVKVCLVVEDVESCLEYVADLIAEGFDFDKSDNTARYLPPVAFSEQDWAQLIEFGEDGKALVPILRRQKDHKRVLVTPYESIRGGFSLLFTIEGTPVKVYGSSEELQLSASASVEDGVARLRLLDERYKPKLVALTWNRSILWARPLTEKEASSGTVELELLSILCDSTFRTKNQQRAKVCLIVEDAEEGNEYVADLIAEGFDFDESDNAARYLSPVVFSEQDWEGKAELDEDGTPLVPILRRQKDHQRVLVSPYENVRGGFSLLFTVEGTTAQAYYRPYVTGLSTPGDKTLTVRIKMPKGNYVIDGVKIENRAASYETSYDAPYTLKEHETFDRLTVRFDPEGLVFDGVFWDLYVYITDNNGYTTKLPCTATDLVRHSLFFVNPQCILSNGNVFFPYIWRGRLAFTHRAYDKFDSSLTKVKEWAAFGTYALLLPYWKHRHIWLTYEKYCFAAQDNGYYFFKYCMEDAPEEARKHVYYVIKKDAAEYQNVKQYGRNVIDFMSYRHMLYAMAAQIYVSSDTRTHLYHWRAKQSVVRKIMNRKKEFFLQHGVMAMKRVDYLLGTRGTTPMTYFLTSSEPEQDIIVENFGYKRNQVPVIGLSRWDVLQDKSDKDAPSILLMPTWRQWLEGVDDETFLNSDYFKAYSELIKSKELTKLLEDGNVTIKFFIHPKLSEQFKFFEKQTDRVELIEMGSRPMNELIMECSACITDYSSVAWDVLYQEKPVIYYQFDQERYMEEVGSYIDFDTELPGPICMDLDDIISAISSLIDNEFELDSEHVEMTRQWYAYKDTNNRKRTYDFLQKRFPF